MTWKAVTVHYHRESYGGGQAEAAYAQHQDLWRTRNDLAFTGSHEDDRE